MPTPVASPAAIAAVQDILREVWVSDTLESQLLDETVLLDWMEDVQDHTDADGLKASVPLRTGRTGGIGARGIGQKLPPAEHQRVGKASYNYTFQYLTVKILGPIVAKMETNKQAAVKEIDLEINNGIEDFKMDLQRQLHSAGDAVLFSCAAATSSTTITPQATDYFGRHAIRCGWIYEGMWLDLGTKAAPTVAAQGVQILDVDPATFTITLDTAVTVTTSHFAFRYGNRSAVDGSYEVNGLENIIETTGVLGGIDPTQAGKKFWKSKILGNSGTLRAMSIDLLLKVEAELRRSGSKSELLLGDLDQERRYYNLLSPVVRFMGDKNLSSGNIGGIEFNGKRFVGDPHCPPNKVDFLSKGSLFKVSAGDIAWQNQTTGGDKLAWVQDEDAFVARAAKYFQVATDKRNGLGRLDDLDAS